MNWEIFRPHMILELWYVVLPICVFLVFMARYLEKILMPLLGFLIGSFFVSPLLIDWMGKVEFLKDLQQKLLQSTAAHSIFVFIVGVLCGAVLYGLYKIFVFLAGFLAAGALGYFVTRLIVQDRDLGTIGQIELRVILPFVVGAILGIICGLIAVRKSSQVLAVVSLLVASGLLAFSLVGWAYVWITKSPVEQVSKLFENIPIVFSLLVTWLVLLAFGLILNFKGRIKRPPKENKSAVNR